MDLVTLALAKKYTNDTVLGLGALKGQDGKSAYQIAVDKGFIGSEEEWLASLEGEQGEQGEKGEQGEPGESGVYIGPEKPTDDTISVWIDTDEEDIFTMEPLIDIRKFGAVANDANIDNSIFITEAINYAANNKGRVYIPPDTFYVSSTIPVQNKENLVIINDGILHMQSKPLNNNNFTTLFAVYKSTNCYFSMGTIKSDRDQIGKAPTNHTREDLSSSNILGIVINDSSKIIVDNYMADGLESAVVVNSDDGIFSKDILVKNIKVKNTSQPFFGAGFDGLRVENYFCEECPKCGKGDHFVYISEDARNFSLNNAKFKYTEQKYGVAILLRNSHSSANIGDAKYTVNDDGSFNVTTSYENINTKETYDDSKDLDVAYISNVQITDCVQFVAAKAKTKVYINNCFTTSYKDSTNPLFVTEEFAEFYVDNCRFVAPFTLVAPPSCSAGKFIFNNCDIELDYIMSRGANLVSDTEKYEKEIVFKNCNIKCTSNNSAVWLGCKTKYNISLINSKLTCSYWYVFYLDNEFINYFILNSEIKGTNRLVYNPEDSYSPINNVKVINCVCENIKKINSSTDIINHNNLII